MGCLENDFFFFFFGWEREVLFTVWKSSCSSPSEGCKWVTVIAGRSGPSFSPHRKVGLPIPKEIYRNQGREFGIWQGRCISDAKCLQKEKLNVALGKNLYLVKFCMGQGGPRARVQAGFLLLNRLVDGKWIPPHTSHRLQRLSPPQIPFPRPEG